MSTARATFRALATLARDTLRDGMPVGGCIASSSSTLLPVTFPSCDSMASIRSLFRAAPLDDAFAAMRSMRRQVDFLRAAAEDETTALDLVAWSDLQTRHAKPLDRIDPLLDAAILVESLLEMEEPSSLDEQETSSYDALLSSLETRRSILAARITPDTPLEAMRQRLSSTTDGFNVKLDANEWLYDRFTKLLPTLVLQDGKSIPFGLAILAQAASPTGTTRPLNASLLERHWTRLAAFPALLASELGDQDAVRHGAATMLGLVRGQLALDGTLPVSSTLPHWVLAKQSVASSMALHLDPWLIMSAEAGKAPQFLNVAMRAPTVVDETAALEAIYGRPVAAALIKAAQPVGGSALLGFFAAPRDVLGEWAVLVRTIVQCHQRCGQADQVARWLHILLAIDPAAEEWGFMLSNKQ